MEIVLKDITEIKNYDKNARTHSDEQIDQIVNSISNFGFNDPIEIDANSVIISGHARLAAALRLGLTKVPTVVHAHLKGTKRDAYMLAANKIAMSSEWDLGLLKDQLNLLDSEEQLFTGFNEEELSLLLNEETFNTGLTDENDCPEIPIETICKLGDLWELGNHRLLCGDSLSIDDIDKLMKGITADMVFTDIPYSISQKSNGLRKLDYGDWDKNVINIGLDILPFAISHNTGPIYIFCGDEQLSNLLIAMKEYKLSTRTFAWIKPNPTVLNGAKLWLPSLELCAYGKPSKAIHNAYCKRGIFEGAASSGDRVHPNQKPVQLIEMCISASTNPGHIVLDLFGGSGSTLIGCEKLKRKCFMMELDPKYCDVIIKRYENFTGHKATRIE
jgi:DNA modification methylase